jgi:uncharacterized protein (DUF1501 family)
MKIKVRIDGVAAIVHDPVLTTFVSGTESNGYPMTVPYVSSDNNINYINVHWPRDIYTGDELFPTMDNNCWDGKCTAMPDWTCLCDIREENHLVFTSLPLKHDVFGRLKIGAFEPELYDGGEYRLVGSADGVEAYAPKDAEDYTKATVFKVIDEFRETKYLKNMESLMVIGTTDEFKMQNPSHYIDFALPHLRDIYYEVDATINNIFKSESTAPFISKILIQRFGVSNPSPRYVEAVATAFFDGFYNWTDGTETYTFGNKDYGDLAATAAAILLDRESLSVVVDADPAGGSLREPWLKVIGFMKSMEYTPTVHNRNEHPAFWKISTKLGQGPYDPPDQFSFFRNDYMPPGGLSRADLTSPEAGALNMYTSIMMTSGLFSMIRNGLTDLGDGFGRNNFGGASIFKTPWNTERMIAGDYDKSVGYLAYAPSSSHSTATTPADKVDELARLLTGGRLSARSRTVLVTVYNDALVAYDGSHDNAWREIVALVTTTPDFHAMNLAKMTNQPRLVAPKKEPKDDSYKAIVLLFLFGGLDSYNLLVPHSTCGKLYDSYVAERGRIALASNEMGLTIDVSTASSDQPNQPCGTFALHPKAGAFRKIYEDNEGIFIANTGHLDRLVTKDDWDQNTRTDLFSHTSLEKEAYHLDPFKDKQGTGLLGRLLDVFENKGYTVGPNSINSETPMLGGDPQKGRKIDVVPDTGIPIVTRQHLLGHQNTADQIKPLIMELNSESAPENGVHANYWSQHLIDNWHKSDTLRAILKNNPTLTTFSFQGVRTSFKMISQMIRAHRDRKVNRDVFFIRLGGYDAHIDVKTNLNTHIDDLNKGFEAFRSEMKAQGNYDKVTVLMQR